MLNECSSRKVLLSLRKCVWLGCWFTSVIPACRRQRQRVGVRGISWLISKLKDSLCYRRGFLQKIKNKQKIMAFCWILDLVILCACFVCSCSHVAMYVPRACRDQKRALDSPDLELWMVVNDGNKTHNLCKSNTCFQSLGHLSSTLILLFIRGLSYVKVQLLSGNLKSLCITALS